MIKYLVSSIDGEVQQVRIQRAGKGGLQPPTQIEVLKKDRFSVDTMISIVLRDLPFRQNQPLKTTDDYYIAVIKNTTKNKIKVFLTNKRTIY